MFKINLKKLAADIAKVPIPVVVGSYHGRRKAAANGAAKSELRKHL